MLVITSIDYNKNYLQVAVKSAGQYFIGTDIRFNQSGIYQVHLPYSVIRHLESGQSFSPIKELEEIYDEAPVEMAKPKPKKKVSKKAKKA